MTEQKNWSAKHSKLESCLEFESNLESTRAKEIPRSLSQAPHLGQWPINSIKKRILRTRERLATLRRPGVPIGSHRNLCTLNKSWQAQTAAKSAPKFDEDRAGQGEQKDYRGRSVK